MNQMMKKNNSTPEIPKQQKKKNQYMTKGDSFTWSFVNCNQNTESYQEIIWSILELNESKKKLETKDITVNDLFVLFVDEKKANKILENKLHISKHWKNYIDEKNKKLNQQWILYFNELLHEGIDFYENVFHEKLYSTYINKRSKDKSGKPICKNHEEIIKFLTYNSNNKRDDINWSHHCFLLKIIRALNDFNIHQKDFCYAQENFEKIKRNTLLPQFKTNKNKFPENETNINHMQLRTKTSVSNKKPVYFTMDSRIKEKERVIIKILSNSKYNSSKAIADIYWIRCKTKDKFDALLLLEYYWKSFPGEIDHKNIFWETYQEIKDFLKDIEKEYKLDEDFKKVLLKHVASKRKKNSSNEKKNNKDYKDVKIKSILTDEDENNQTIEVQIDLEWNRNECWLSHHGVYEVKAIIEAAVRWRWFTTMKKVEKYVEDAINKNINESQIDENPNILYLSWFSRDQIFHELTNKEKEYYKNKTQKYICKNIEYEFLKWQELKYPEKWIELYTTETQRDKFHNNKNEDMYPSNISRR